MLKSVTNVLQRFYPFQWLFGMVIWLTLFLIGPKGQDDTSHSGRRWSKAMGPVGSGSETTQRGWNYSSIFR